MANRLKRSVVVSLLQKIYLTSLINDMKVFSRSISWALSKALLTKHYLNPTNNPFLFLLYFRFIGARRRR